MPIVLDEGEVAASPHFGRNRCRRRQSHGIGHCGDLLHRGAQYLRQFCRLNGVPIPPDELVHAVGKIAAYDRRWGVAFWQDGFRGDTVAGPAQRQAACPNHEEREFRHNTAPLEGRLLAAQQLPSPTPIMMIEIGKSVTEVPSETFIALSAARFPGGLAGGSSLERPVAFPKVLASSM